MTLSCFWGSSQDKHRRIVQLMFFSVVSTAVFMLDRITKNMAASRLDIGQSVEVVPNIFNITLIFNKGAAFGLFKNLTALFALFSAAVIIFIIFYIWKNTGTGIAVLAGFGLILGGAAGNLVDRVRLGYVIDFLDFKVWPVFNIADSSITIGTALLAAMMLFGSRTRP